MPEYTNEASAWQERTRPVSAHEFLAPLCTQWKSLFAAAEKAKEAFDVIAYQCDSFFTKSGDFMWKPSYKDKFIGQGLADPKFKISINKAFDIVAIIGPYLFWKYPQVRVRTADPFEITPEGIDALLQDLVPPDLDPAAREQLQQQALQDAQAREQYDTAIANLRNQLMEKYLNYSQHEQPGGGLAKEVEIAVTESLIKGRACLWTTSYQCPGSGRRLTSRRWYNVDDLLIDPDSRDPNLTDAKWIALRHDDLVSDFERLLGLPPGTCTHANYESSTSLATGKNLSTRAARKNGSTANRIVWYEVWSKMGVGNRLSYPDGDGERLTSISPVLHDSFDEVVGDYAYLVVADGLPYPANAPSWIFRDPHSNEPLATDDDIRDAFQWRTAGYGPHFPCYLDFRWPVELIDYYKTYGSSWPIAPLAPALGPLTILNILASSFTEQAYENRKTIIAYLESAAKELKTALTSSDNPAMLPLNDMAGKSISDMIQFLQRPEMNRDIMDAIPFIENMIEQRTGLPAWMYAQETSKERSATAARSKDEKVAIRPDKMAQDVSRALTESAESEKFLAAWTVTGRDVAPLFGAYGAALWDKLIVEEDPEVLVREMRCTIEASDHRKPNRERLMANLQESLQFLLPILQAYAVDTGDTNPLNQFLSAMNLAMEEKIMPMLGPWRPEPDPQQAAAQQVMAQLEQAKLEAEVMGKQADAAKKQADQQSAAITMQAEDDQHQQQMIHNEESHDQELSHKQDVFNLELQNQRQEAKIKLDSAAALAATQLRAKAAQSQQTTISHTKG